MGLTDLQAVLFGRFSTDLERRSQPIPHTDFNILWRRGVCPMAIVDCDCA
jgi:hypothetical protein